MAEETGAPQITEDASKNKEFKELYEKQTEALKQRETELKSLKDRQGGADKKINDLLAELEEIKTSQMKAEEKRKYQEEKREKELTDREAALKKETVSYRKLRLLNKYNLNESLLPRIQGESEEEIEGDIKSLIELMNLDVQKQVTERLTSGPKPTGVSGPTKTGGAKTEAEIAAMSHDERKAYFKSDEWKQLVAKYKANPSDELIGE